MNAYCAGIPLRVELNHFAINFIVGFFLNNYYKYGTVDVQCLSLSLSLPSFVSFHSVSFAGEFVGHAFVTTSRVHSPPSPVAKDCYVSSVRVVT